MTALYYRFPGSLEDIHAKVEHLRTRSAALCRAADEAKCDTIREFAGLYASFAGCMELFAKTLPYKVGDRVRLVDPPPCEGGWATSKHFLIEGALGTVKIVSLDYLMRDWCVFVEFDDESHICTRAGKHWETGIHYEVGDRIPTPPGRRHVSPVPMRVVLVARDNRLEGVLHEICAVHRAHGEWFDAAGVMTVTETMRRCASGRKICLRCAWEHLR